MTTPQEHHPVEADREYVTMALYISLSLLAVTLAAPRDEITAAITMLLTALGLVLAHLLAFAMSSRLVSGGLLDKQSLKLLGVQASAGATVAIVATLPVLLLPEPNGVQVAGLLLLLIIAVVGFRAARSGGAGLWRSLAYVGVVVLLVLVVLGVKALVH